MLEQFKGFLGYTEEEFSELWKEAIIVVDTNILINFYKYTTKESTKKLLDILKKLKSDNRLWIPHQVALEYFFNYESNLFKQQEGYNFLKSEIAKLKDDAQKALTSVKNKHPYINVDKFNFIVDDIGASNQKLEESIDKEFEKLPDSTEIHQNIIELMDGIIGNCYSQEEINDIEKEGKNRYQDEIPPGFEDKNDKDKQGFRSYGDFKYQQLYGDLIVWFQIIDKAKKDEVSVLLITEDRKRDWWDKDGTKIKRPHPQLIQEFINKSKKNFYMYRTDNFVSNAIKHLGMDFSDKELSDVTKDIENIRKIEDLKLEKRVAQDNDYIETDEIVRFLNENEKEIYASMLNDSFNTSDKNESFEKFLLAKDWAIEKAIPHLERIYNECIMKERRFSKQGAMHMVSNLSSLPSDNYNRARSLLNLIYEEVHI